jgi:hypothetical protein
MTLVFANSHTCAVRQRARVYCVLLHIVEGFRSDILSLTFALP